MRRKPKVERVWAVGLEDANSVKFIFDVPKRTAKGKPRRQQRTCAALMTEGPYRRMVNAEDPGFYGREVADRE